MLHDSLTTGMFMLVIDQCAVNNLVSKRTDYFNIHWMSEYNPPPKIKKGEAIASPFLLEFIL
jgi:hypothetical protein